MIWSDDEDDDDFNNQDEVSVGYHINVINRVN